MSSNAINECLDAIRDHGTLPALYSIGEQEASGHYRANPTPRVAMMHAVSRTAPQRFRENRVPQ